MLVYRFIPEPLKNNDLYDALYGVEYDEAKNVNSSILILYKNGFVATANEEGISRLEKIYGIRYDVSKTLEERREELHNKMIYLPPITMQKLVILLDNTIGEGNYSFEVIPEDFTLLLSVRTHNSKSVVDYMKRVRNIIPANLLLLTDVPFTYIYLSNNLTYNDMGAYTYGELSLVS